MRDTLFPLTLLIGLLLFAGTALADGEKIIFLHHSTGGNVYREGNVPDWLHTYNPTLEISERNYPTNGYPWSNYPYDYWNLWINGACAPGNPNMECLNNLAAEFDVIIFKHCFPGAAIQPDTGTPDVSSNRKSLENYKAQYRALRAEMDKYPDTIFIIWTLAPLHRLATNPEQAARAWQFVQWVKNEFLVEDGREHPNIFIFDFFGIVAEKRANPPEGQQYCLKYEYERSHTGSDSHPNTLANQTAGPLFAKCIADAVAKYHSSARDVQRFSGDFSGTYWGGDSGSWNFWIGVNGLAGGAITNERAERFQLTGSITNEGDLTLCTPQRFCLYGHIDPATPNAIAGDWHDETSGHEGTFSGERIGPSWIRVGGAVKTGSGGPVCAMVLANGQYQFSDSATGVYDFNERGIPLDEDGQLTIFAFADGFAPFKQVITPDAAADFQIVMDPVDPTTPEIDLSMDVEGIDSQANLAFISGQVKDQYGNPICAMVLANGQYQFSDMATGSYGFYKTGIPFNQDGLITLFVFADGFQPYKLTYSLY